MRFYSSGAPIKEIGKHFLFTNSKARKHLCLQAFELQYIFLNLTKHY